MQSQRICHHHLQLKDKQGRIGHLQSKSGVIAFTIGENETMLDRLIDHEKGVSVELPIHPTSELVIPEVSVSVPVESVGFSNLSNRREAQTWPVYIKERFSSEVMDWYIADVILNEKEKIEHLLNLNWSDPPRYAKPLIAKTSDGKNLYILGSKNIYNNAKEKTTPIGSEEDAYRAWLKIAKDSFIAKRSDLFASIKDGGIIFNMDEKASSVTRAARAKNIGGRQCTTYQAGLLDKFSEWLVGSGFPEEVKTKKDRCLFLDLLVREAVLSGKEGIFWVTPEEYSIFSEDDNRSDLLKRLKD